MPDVNAGRRATFLGVRDEFARPWSSYREMNNLEARKATP
jgi:hypothetical protein